MVQALQQISLNAIEHSKPPIIMFGTVKSVDPLEVYVDQKTILKQRELVLSRNVTDFQTEISFDNPDIKNWAQFGNRPLAKDGTLITKPDTKEESSTPAIFMGNFSFKQQVKHEITVYNGLKAGEKVVIVRIQGGQRFLIIDRIGDDGNAS